MQTQTANAETAPAPVTVPNIRRMWAPAIIALGVVISGGWIFLLGYGLITLMMLAL